MSWLSVLQNNDRVLYLTPTSAVTPTDLSSIEDHVGKGNVTVVGHASSSDFLQGNTTYNAIISIGASSMQHQADFLSGALRVLKPGGTLVLREPLLLDNIPDQPLRTEASIKTALMINGFLNVQATSTQKEISSATFGGVATRVATFEIVSTKPSWEVGAKFELFRPQKTTTSSNVWVLDSSDTMDDDIAIVPRAQNDAIWKISVDDMEDDQIDEDSLLTAEDLTLPSRSAPRDDCELGKGGKRRACKSCTCGRAEGDKEEPKATTAPAPAPKPAPAPEPAPAKSACGSCYLGDAFRCDGCPYTGLPPFKEGERISIPL